MLLILGFAQCKVFSVLFGRSLFCLSHEAVYMPSFSLFAKSLYAAGNGKAIAEDNCKSPLLVSVYIEKRMFFTLSDEVHARDCSCNSRMKDCPIMLVSGMLVIQRKTYPCQLKFYDYFLVNLAKV